MTNHIKSQIRGAVIDQPHRWAGAVLLLALASLAVPAYRWIEAERAQVGSVGRAIDAQGAQTREWMRVNLVPPVNRLTDAAAGIPDVVAGEFRRQADALQKNVFTQIDAARLQVLAPDGRWVDLQNAVLQRVDESLGKVDPVLVATAGTVASIGRTAKIYGELPDGLAVKLGPSWAAIEPEITCRKPSWFGVVGYGGCIHNRVVGLMGEALKIGGTFTTHFPSIADSATKTGAAWAGISADLHLAADKYLVPHPAIGWWAKIKLGLKMLKDFALAFVRGGGLSL